MIVESVFNLCVNYTYLFCHIFLYKRKEDEDGGNKDEEETMRVKL